MFHGTARPRLRPSAPPNPQTWLNGGRKAKTALALGEEVSVLWFPRRLFEAFLSTNVRSLRQMFSEREPQRIRAKPKRDEVTDILQDTAAISGPHRHHGDGERAALFK